MFLQSHEIPPNVQHVSFDSYSAETTVSVIKAYILRCNFSEVSNKNLIMNQSDGSDQMESNLVVSSADYLAKASHTNPIIEVRNSSIKQSRTEHEDNCGCCHVM